MKGRVQWESEGYRIQIKYCVGFVFELMEYSVK